MLGALCSVLGAGALCWVLGASTTADAVVEAAREYLKQYQVDLTFVVAEERSVQRLLRQVPPVPDAVTRRQMTSEVHFRFVAGDGQWMPIRDVKVVDGKDVPPRGDLSDALASPNVAQVVRAFKAFNSQFNIGRLSRNFNEPTLALSVLDPGRAEGESSNRAGCSVLGAGALCGVHSAHTRHRAPSTI